MSQVSAVNNTNHFLQTQNQKQQNETPQEDFLLLAGSKVSASDIYNQEIDLPLDRTGKYYRAEDVDNLFILINGVFTSVSEQAFRTDKSMKQVRGELEALKAEKQTTDAVLDRVKSQLETASNQRDRLQNQLMNSMPSDVYQTNIDLGRQQIDDLTEQLNSRNQEYSEMLQSTSEKMQSQTQAIEQLQAQVDQLEKQNQQLVAEKQDLSNQLTNAQQSASAGDKEGLQRDYDVLNYKYESLKTLSVARIDELTKQVESLSGHKPVE